MLQVISCNHPFFGVCHLLDALAVNQCGLSRSLSSQYFFLLPLLFFFFFFFGLFAFSRAAPTAHGGSQARGPIRPVAAGHSHSHSNAGSESCL